MRERRLSVGDIILISLPQHLPAGHEQSGLRPAIVAGLPDILGKPRYPILFVVPLTTRIGQWARKNPQLYPILTAKTGGVPQKSAILLDQLRAVDASRVSGCIGAVERKMAKYIQNQLMKMIAATI